MIAMGLHLELMFCAVVAVNLINLLLLLKWRRSKWLFILPWLGVLGGLAWFAACRNYLDRPELSLSLPVRLEILLLPALMLASLGAGVARLIQQVKSARQTPAERP